MEFALVDTELERLKQILLGEEYRDLLRLRDSINDEQQFVRRVEAVIAESLRARASADDSIALTLAPIIEQAINQSIEQDPQKLAVSLYPVMGPSIRKSISETLQHMLESVNELLEASLSPRSLRWRIDAWRSGRSYSEIVMLHTLEFRVEQVFLIHCNSSLLLQHQVASGVAVRDGDMVSGMLSAIQDFIKDSFSTLEGDQLDKLRLGDLSVILQRGPLAVLATVVRGQVPEHLPLQQTRLLERIHQRKKAQLANYQGDPQVFDDVAEDLRGLLQSKRKSEAGGASRKAPWLAISGLLLLAAVAIYWQYNGYQLRQQQQGVLALLEAEPGLVVLSSSSHGKQFEVNLLVDPLARPAAEVLNSSQLASAVDIRQRSYLSLAPAIVTQRARRLLHPPADVDMEVSDATLWLSGEATPAWLAMVRERWPGLAGVDALDSSRLLVKDPLLDNLKRLREAIESLQFVFSPGEVELDVDTAPVAALVQAVRQLNELSQQRYQQPLRLDIIGYTDASGDRANNARIGTQRAEALKGILLSRGVGDAEMRVFNKFDYGEGAASERKAKIVVRID